MKSRDEFLGSVYAKRDAELARRKKYKKGIYSGLASCAACLVLTVGLVQADGGTDGAAATEGVELFNGAVVSESETPSHDSDMDTEAGAAPGMAAPSREIYDLVTDDSRAMYYCLPCFTIEEMGDGDAQAARGGGLEAVEKVRVWVRQLEEQGQVLPGEPGSLENVTCIVTIETEAQQKEVYWLTGEVGWYE